MVKVTLEVPEALLGDIYVAVGGVLEHARVKGLLERGRLEAEQGAEQVAAPEPGESKQVPAEA
ncbi:MAG TPA: hypothetical protein VME44_09010 [Streptosporangiaceae bacterium]|nr:hypothetical protein [Streptosporangiaceae bacterium]